MPYMSSIPPGADYYQVMREQVAPVTAGIRARTAERRVAAAPVAPAVTALQQRLQAQALGAPPVVSREAALAMQERAIAAGQVTQAGVPLAVLGMGLGGLAAKVGLPAWLGTALGAAGWATMAADIGGMAWPWETPPGEGFIAPWTGEMEVAPGVTGVTGVDYPGIIEGFIPGRVAPYGKSVIVKIWNTNPEAPQYGQAFAMDADGWIYTQKKNGVVKRWKPAKHLVIPTNINKLPVGRLVRAERLIDRLMRKVARRSPSLKLAK